jgi:two-component system, cell cycle response regulator
VLLDGADEAGALAVAERMREAIRTVDGPAPLTASLGVAVFPADGRSGKAVVAAADAALYAAKAAGRDRVVRSSTERLVA